MAGTIGTAYIQIEPSAKGIEGSIEKAINGGSQGYGKALTGALGTAGKMAGAAIAGATTAVGAFGAASVKTGADFDKSMSQVAATMGKTMEEMETETGSVDLAWGNFSGNLRDYAQEMGKNTAFSATEAADALNYMALAGYDAQTSMEMLPNVLNLAAAGGMDLAKSSDMITDTQTAFGISLERTSQMVDEMAKAASTGNTSVEQLGDAFLTVGGLAQELNGGIVTLSDGTTQSVDGVQELEIALTAMANAGVKGSEAGTHMRNMLLKLSSPTKEGAMQLEALGVSVFDAEGQMRSLSDIFGDLSGALGDLTQEQKIEAISDLFNTRDLASAEALLNAVGQDWDAIGASILEADGAAQLMADTQLDNLAGDVTLFKSALEGAQIAISDTLSPALRDFVQFGTDGLGKLTTAFQEGGLTGAMEAFGEVLADGLNMVIEKLPEFVDAGMQLLGALGQGIFDNLPVIIDAAGQIIVQLIEGIAVALPELAEGAMQIIGQLATFLGEQLPELIPTVVEMIMGIVEAIIDNADLVIDGAIALIMGLAEGIINSLPVLIEKAPEIIEKLVAALVENVPKLIDGAIQLVTMIVQNMPEIIQGLIDAAPDIITALAEGLIQAAPQLAFAGPQIMFTFAQSFIDAAPTLYEKIGELFTVVGETLATEGAKLGETVSGILSPIWDSVSTWGSTVMTNIGTFFSNLLTSIESWLSGLPDKMAYYAGYAIGSFIKFFDELPDKVKKDFDNAIKKAAEFGRNIASKAKSAGKDFINGMINELTALPNKFKELLNQLVSAAEELPGKFLSIGSNIVESLKNGISEAWGSIKGWFNDKLGSLVEGAKSALSDNSSSGEEETQSGVDALNSQVEKMSKQMISNAVSYSIDSMDSMSYMPGPMAYQMQESNKTLELLARYLPEIADKSNMTVEVRQDKQGTFNAVWDYNNKFINATGYHALA